MKSKILLFTIFTAVMCRSQLQPTRANPPNEIPSARVPSSFLKTSKPSLPELPSIAHKLGPADILSLPPLDLTELLREDAQAEKTAERRVRIGVERKLDVDSRTYGTWAQVDAFTRVWRLDVNSKDAIRLGVTLNLRGLDLGSSLFIYGNDPTKAQHYWADATPDHLWFAEVEGETLHIELEIPARTTVDPVLSLHRVYHVYRGPESSTAGACNLDAACYPDWAASSNAVGRMSVFAAPFVYYCSGVLLNNATGDFSPMFLTANHCIENLSIDGFGLLWKYKNATCNGPTANWIGSTGATVLASAQSPDFALLLIRGIVPRDLTWSGSNANALAAGTAVIGLHHPDADMLKISFGNISSETTLHNVHWAQGVTEPGSSGSPLFDVNHLVTGVLSTGLSSCSNQNGVDNYVKFSGIQNGIQSYLQQGTADDGVNNHTRQTALPIVPATFENRVLKLNADDWYKVALPSGQVGIIQFASNPFAFDSYVELFREDEPTPRIVQTTSQQIGFLNDGADANYYVRFYVGQGVRTDYGFTLAIVVPQKPTVETLSGNIRPPNSVNVAGRVFPNSSTTHAWFEYGTDPNLTTYSTIDLASEIPAFIEGPATVAVEISGVTAGVTYYYRIGASNFAGTSRGQIQSFQIPAGPPPAPTLVAPEQGTSAAPYPVEFVWNPSPGAVDYELSYSLFDAPSARHETMSGTYYPIFFPGFDLPPETEMAWWVTARNQVGSSTPSEVRYFKTGRAAGFLNIAPQTLFFQRLFDGAATEFQSVVVTNSNAIPVTGLDPTFAGSSDFQIDNQCPTTLQPNQTCTLRARLLGSPFPFPESTSTMRSGSMQLHGSASTPRVSLVGVISRYRLSTQELDFGARVADGSFTSQLVTIESHEPQDQAVALKIDNADFALADQCGGTVSAGGTCNIKVTFAPARPGLHRSTATLTLGTSDISSSISVPLVLRGTGIRTFVTLTRPKRPTRPGSPFANARWYSITAVNKFVGAMTIACRAADRRQSCEVRPYQLTFAAGLNPTREVRVRFKQSHRLPGRSGATLIFRNGAGNVQEFKVQD